MSDPSTNSGPGQSNDAIASPATQRQIAISANRIDARELFSATREILIAHGEDMYRLRLTSQNKLILTK